MWRKPSAYNRGSLSHSIPQTHSMGYPQSHFPLQNQSRGYPQSHNTPQSQTSGYSTPQSQSRSYSPSPIIDLTDDSGFLLSSHTPSVTFDLGNEWDDFDDDNLVHASETSCTTVAKTQGMDRDRLKGILLQNIQGWSQFNLNSVNSGSKHSFQFFLIENN